MLSRRPEEQHISLEIDVSIIFGEYNPDEIGAHIS